MKVILEVTSGPDASRSFAIEPGEEVRVGRTAPARILLPGDRTVSRLHFAIQCDGLSCRIRDLESSHGTLVNGLRVTESLLSDGDVIVAGTTALRVQIGEDLSTARVPLTYESGWPGEALVTELGHGVDTIEHQHLVEEPTLHDRVLDVLRAQKAPLLAILDAARDPLVYLRIQECPERKQSLYEGPEGERLAFLAPYLVALPGDSPFLPQLVREGWGNAWGVFLTCDRPFEEVRRQLRRFLTVELDGKNEKVLFRFYDPRVLRVFLPACSPQEMAEFFGPIEGFLLEAAEPGEIFSIRQSAATAGSKPTFQMGSNRLA